MLNATIDDLVAAQHRDMYEALTRLRVVGADIDPAICDFGVRVKATEHGWVVLGRQLFNWRIVDARNDPFAGVPTAMSGYLRGWCYAEPNSFLSSMVAAVAWSGQPDTEPSGWIKSVPDGRRHSEPHPHIRQE